MSKIWKRLQKFSNNPKEVKWDLLKTVIEYYGLTVENPNGGSHFLVYHDADRENTMIPVPVHNNRVKAIYVKRVIKLIQENGLEEE